MSKLTASALALALFIAAVPAIAGQPVSVSVEFALVPSAKAPNSFVARAIVRDSATDEVLSAPSIAFLRGDEAKTSTRLPNGSELRVTVLVPDAANQATYSVELLEGGKTTLLQKASVTLGN
jgi:hypothetical protein